MNGETLFRQIPDTVFVTDPYGYILDFNRKEPLPDIRKGKKLTAFLPGCFDSEEGEFHIDDRVYRRLTTTLVQNGAVAGYTVMLSDVTEETRLTAQLHAKKEELQTLAEDLRRSNEELEGYARKVRELSDYAEQLRVARQIHDDAGHAVTEIHAICAMCLQLRESDPGRYRELLEQGQALCQRAESESGRREDASLAELLDRFCRLCRFPVEAKVYGEEPAFLKEKYREIERVLREAYHNTLSHSLADRLFVRADLSADECFIRIWDDGRFRGGFEKGFGLRTMEEYVRASGGSVEFTAEEGKGFAIAVTWRVEI